MTNRNEHTFLLQIPSTDPTGTHQIVLKCESRNSSGSVHDRGMATAFAHAKASGIDRVEFSGVAWEAVSGSAFAAREGIQLTVAVEAGAVPLALQECWLYGAKISRTASQTGLRAIGGTLDLEQLRLEGLKELAAELVEQLGGIPAAILIPAGDGLLHQALSEGFSELSLGAASHPRLIAVSTGGALGSGTQLASDQITVPRHEALTEVAELARARGLIVSPSTGASLRAARAVQQQIQQSAAHRAVVVVDAVHSRFFDWGWPNLDLGREGNKLGGLITPR